MIVREVKIRENAERPNTTRNLIKLIVGKVDHGQSCKLFELLPYTHVPSALRGGPE